MVARISCKNEGQRRFLRDPLEHGNGERLPADIRAALEYALGKPLRKPNFLRTLRGRLRLRQRLRFVLAR